MTPATPLIPIRAGCPPIPFSPLQNLHHPSKRRDNLLPERSEHDLVTPCADDLDGCFLCLFGRCEKVEYGFVVDFEVGAPEEVLPARGTPDACKYITHGARDDARFKAGGIAGQSVGFTGGCLSIGEDDGVITRHGSVNEGAAGTEIERLGRRRCVDDGKRVRRRRSRRALGIFRVDGESCGSR